MIAGFVASLIARARSLRRALRGRSVLDAEMSEEFLQHIELRTQDLVRRGVAPDDAARRARLEFGSTEHYKVRGRESRGTRPFDTMHISWMDFRLGARMLVKYPGLSLVSGVAFAGAIAIGAASFQFISQMVNPEIPLDDGSRIVGIRTWNAAESRVELRVLYDLENWRRELHALELLGAFRSMQRNVTFDARNAEPMEIAEISASAFALARVPALLGRTLVPSDEAASGAEVIVIGHSLWQSKFDGDRQVVGRTVRIGRTLHTIVGVMPEGFAFPVSHAMWVPLRIASAALTPVAGPEVRVFGRLARDATFEQARTELAAIAARAAVEHSATHANLRPEILPYARSLLNSELPETAFLAVNVFLAMLVILVCGNVALLIFARTATRISEIVVRSALGASRGRIIMQLFAESLLLGGVAAIVGLSVARLGLRLALGVMANEQGAPPPFWITDHLAPGTIVYALVLTLLGAAMAGVIPALKVTDGLQSRLRQSGGGGGGLRFGGVWTVVIVAQVAVTVAFPATAFFARRDGVQVRTFDPGIREREYLAALLALDGMARDEERSAGKGADLSHDVALNRFAASRASLAQRVLSEDAVVDVTFINELPHTSHAQRRIEVEGLAVARSDSGNGVRVSSAYAAANYFETMQASVRSGRAFVEGDITSDARVVVVNESFVKHALGGRQAVGRRVRYLDDPDPDARDAARAKPGEWLDIIGVVPDLGMTDGGDPTITGAGIYRPLTPARAYPVQMVIRARGEPAALAPRVRTIATSLDPTLRVDAIIPLDHLNDAALRSIDFWVRLLAGVSASALLLSLAGIYSVMSLTVSRRTREIGIRVAVGANRWRIVAATFARPLMQVGIGVVVGTMLVGLLVMAIIGQLSPREILAVAGYAALMLGVCMLACVMPTRRALAIEPTEALRAEG